MERRKNCLETLHCNEHHLAPLSLSPQSPPDMIPKIPSQYLSFALGFLLCATIPFVHAESSTCLTIYKNGGAPAVFQSPKCPRWKLSDYDSPPQTTARCQIAMLQGRRKSQEDRALCVLDVRIPFPGANGIKEVPVGVVAVFDGHNGAEASEMASKLLLEYFVLHTYFLLDAAFSVISKTSSETLLHKRDHDHVNVLHRWKEILGLEWHELHFERVASLVYKFQNTFSPNFDDSFHLEILKEALLRAVHDIDANFSEEASRNNLHSGSTATIVLIADDKILVANIGDSKAILCSENFQTPREAKGEKDYEMQKERDSSVSMWDREKYKLASSHGLTHFAVKELTSDHHPDRDDERIRVETAGGQVQNWDGLPRINGQLAVTRAIGDVPFKSYGVISAPEVTDWQPLTANDSYLVVASDGVFEKMSLQDVCDLLWEVSRFSNMRSECTPSSYSLADLLVKNALKKGSMDNVAAVVIPLKSVKSSGNLLGGSYIGKRDAGFPLFGFQETAFKSSDLTCDEAASIDCSLLLAASSQSAFGSADIDSLVLQPPLSICSSWETFSSQHIMYASVNTHDISYGISNDIATNLMHLEHPHLVDTNFKRILVQVKDGDVGCFYLSENLDEPEDSKQIAKKIDWDDYLYELPPPLPDALHQHATSGGPVNLYDNNQNFCFHLGPTVNETEDQCINPEGFASFIGLLESIPLHDSDSSNGSTDYSMPDLKYELKKSFGRGSFGEVWLAFHWNCNQHSNAAKMSKDVTNTTSSSTASDCQDGCARLLDLRGSCLFYSFTGLSFVPLQLLLNALDLGVAQSSVPYFKRKLCFQEVERGSAVYLSGLREKYFGEIFLNASTCFEDSLSAGKSNCVLETSSQFGPEKSFPNKFWLRRTPYEEGLNHIARYVESFESLANEIWLVFSYEGVSLSKLLYTGEDTYGTAEQERLEQAKHAKILRPSNWWHWLKTTEEGQAEMRNLIWQLVCLKCRFYEGLT
ncbi:unnamed protein product [Sphenostylis stenocarpa]|uniref:PPM-type phosphatase domain-containing protein n=1 Tax=Sphenostylis stenocarpa TaxID=92480 RepID=A0AA86VMI3_9FABA|nr:unnamed protein product [Sphenostylis stenocarpa]